MSDGYIEVLDTVSVVEVLNDGGLVEIIQTDMPVNVVSEGLQGPQGPPGPPGTGTQIAIIPAGETIPINTICVLNEAGHLMIADPTNRLHGSLISGMAISAGTYGQNINFILSGEILGFSSLDPTRLYYLGLNGTLSTTVIAIGATWFRFLGQPISNSSFLLQNKDSILLN